MKGIKVLVLASVMFAVGRVSKKKLKIDCLYVSAAYLKDGVQLNLINLNNPKKTIKKTFNKQGDELVAYFGIVSHD